MRWISDQALDRLRAVGRMPDLSASGYRLVDVIGQGGMGIVYLAQDPKLRRQVALKVLDAPDASGQLAARLMREAQVLARLEHPGIVPVHDVGVLEDGRVFYTMKLVRGHQLDDYLRTPRTLPERLRLFLRVCEAVAFAHEQGVLHRDLKPANIMVGAFGEVLVMDWGVAKVLNGVAEGVAPDEAELVEAQLVESGEGEGQGAPGDGAGDVPGLGRDLDDVVTEAGSIIGTRGYMSPEQARGQVDRLDQRSDVFALGALLTVLVAEDGAAPEATTLALPEGDLPAPVSTAADVPKRLAAVIRQAMATSPEDRYPGVQELARDIERYLDGGSVSALPESLWSKTLRFLSRHRVAVVLILVYVLVRTLVLLFSGR